MSDTIDGSDDGGAWRKAATLSESITREIALPELAKLGFVEGRTLAFDGRVGEWAAQPGLMRELLATGPDAVIAIGPAARAGMAGQP